MSKLLNIEDELKNISKKYWQLDYNNLYLRLDSTYTIRITKVSGEVWFDVVLERSLEGRYLFSSQDLKEALDWCYDNLNIDFMYY